MFVFPTSLLVPPVVASGGNPTVPFENVVLLCHFNGADNSTTFTDEKGNAISRVSLEERIRTTQFKYGGASAYFSAADGAALVIAMDESLHILESDFTIETWIYPLSVSNSRPIIAQWSSETGNIQRGFILRTNGTSIEFLFGAESETTPILTGGTLSINTWHHIAVTRNDDLFTLWFDGVGVDTYTTSATRSILSTNLSIGDYYNAGGGVGAVANTLDAYLDDLRICNVFAYVEPFTPPEAQFPDS